MEYLSPPLNSGRLSEYERQGVIKEGVVDSTKRKTADLQRFFKCLRGVGGSRTLVQTRKPYAFYMLISAFDFRA